MSILRQLIVGVTFLTRFPLKCGEVSPQDMAKATAWFPIIGAGIGTLSGGAYLVGSSMLGSLPGAALALATEFLVTGGLHLDGLSDTADGLLSGRSRQQSLEIMRDSRIGTMGAAVLALTLIFRFSLLSSMVPQVALWGLLLSSSVSRGIVAFCGWAYPYARQQDGLGLAVARHTGLREVVLASLLVLVLGLLSFPFLDGLIASSLGLAAGALLSYLIALKLGGMTGDCYGAVIELTETITLALILGIRQ